MKIKQSLARTAALSLVFAAAGAAQVSITPLILPDGTVGVPYQQDSTTGINAPFNWTLLNGALPPGLTLANVSPPSNTGQVGRIQGTPTTAGTYFFTLQAQFGTQIGMLQQTIVILANRPIATAPASLTFTGISLGEMPPQQFLLITAVRQAQLGFTVQVDDGAGGPQPAWIGSVPRGATVSRLPVEVDPSQLQPGTYRARVRVTASSGGEVLNVPVSFNVTAAAPKLSVFPKLLRFGGRFGAPGQQVQDILVTNGGGGAGIAFTSTIVNKSSWLSVAPGSGTTQPNAPQLLRVIANTNGVPIGGLRDTLRISSNAGTFEVTVVLFITADGPVLQLGDSARRIHVLQNGKVPVNQTLDVFNTGAPGTSVNWTATTTIAPGGVNTVNLVNTTGRSTVSGPSTVEFGAVASADTLPVGAYYTLLTVSDPNAINSPQYVAVVVDVELASTPLFPDASPASLVFTAVQDSTTAPVAQTVRVTAGTVSGGIFYVGYNTYDGGTWLNVARTSGGTGSTNPATFPVAVNHAGLRAGVYIGQVDFLLALQSRSILVLLIVLPPGATLGSEVESANAPETERAVTGCTPTSIVIAPGIISSFSTPASWPASIHARLIDNCGSPILGGTAVASFDNGDSPLTLDDYGGNGTYLATWTPSFPAANVAITFSASSGALPPNTYQVVGGINANKLAPPQLFDGGTVNNTNPLGGALLAPGTVTAAYGQNLASSTMSPGVIPLVNIFNGTTLIMGGIPAPLYFLSSGQLNIQAPVDLPVNQQVSVAVTAGTAFAVLPKPVGIIAAAPGISSFANTNIIAQHANFTLIDAASPSKAGESIVTYVSGMGATNPIVASGQMASPTALSPSNIQPTVTVDGINATVLYGGLTPGGIGLYQINFTVPGSTRTGDAIVSITQNGIIANVTKLPVVAQ